MSECPECVGGQVSWLDEHDYTVWGTCPKCDGSGVIPSGAPAGRFGGFDLMCDEWESAHPGEPVPVGELFAQWLADESGTAIVGGPVGEPPAIVALPKEEP